MGADYRAAHALVHRRQQQFRAGDRRRGRGLRHQLRRRLRRRHRPVGRGAGDDRARQRRDVGARTVFWQCRPSRERSEIRLKGATNKSKVIAVAFISVSISEWPPLPPRFARSPFLAPSAGEDKRAPISDHQRDRRVGHPHPRSGGGDRAQRGGGSAAQCLRSNVRATRTDYSAGPGTRQRGQVDLFLRRARPGADAAPRPSRRRSGRRRARSARRDRRSA